MKRILVTGATGQNRPRVLLTGPASLTRREQVQLIGKAIGQPLLFEDLSPESAREQMLAMPWTDFAGTTGS